MERLVVLVRSRRGAASAVVALGVVFAALVAVFRSTQPSETVGVLLYLPIVAAALLFSVRGALISAVVATGIYALIRQSGPVESSPFLPLTVRAVSYIAFGLLVAFGLSALVGGRHRLDNGPAVDDKTGLATITRLVEILDHEIARSLRYDRPFSVAMVDLPNSAEGSKERSAYNSMLGELGDSIRDAIRNTDYAGLRTDQRGTQIVVVLPETNEEGAGIFAMRFGERMADFLMRRSVAVSRNPASWFEFPTDANDVRRVRNELARLVDLPLAIASSGAPR